MDQLGQIIEFPLGAAWKTYGPNHTCVRALMDKMPTLSDVDVALVSSRFSKLDQNKIETAMETAEIVAAMRGRSKPLELARGAVALVGKRACKQAGHERIDAACRAMVTACIVSDVLFETDLRILSEAFLGIFPVAAAEYRVAS